MRTLWRSILAACAAAAVLAAMPTFAQAPSGPADLTEAEVRKVDKENKKVTLKHGQIKNLDMPPMTMVFNVTDAAALEKLQPGDKIRFRAANEGGKYMATEIQPAK
jgi:Cu(I)/Ag(I) efflux system protein CusF